MDKPRRSRGEKPPSAKPTAPSSRTTAPSPRSTAPKPAPTPSELPDNRRGQLASERARYQLRGEEQVLEEGLGTLPPGYGLTFVRGWVRDPRHVVATWDINEEEALRQAEAVGWDRLCVRALDSRNRVLIQILVGRRAGTHHLEAPAGQTVRLAVGLERPDGFFLTLARSGPIRMPPEEPAEPAAAEMIRVPFRLDRRVLLRGEMPARPGHRTPGRMSAAWRLFQRILVALRVLPPEKIPAELRALAGRPEIPTGLEAAAAAAAAPVPGEEHGFREGEAVTSPAGWMPPGPGAPAVPGHWLDRWASGPPPTSPGTWLSEPPNPPVDEPAAPGPPGGVKAP